MTAPVGDTGVDLLVLNGPFEETLTGLAGQEPVVITRDFVATNGTELFDALLSVGRVVRLMAPVVE